MSKSRMKCYTEGDYQSVLRANHLPKLSFQKDYEMFLLDFYPYDKYEFKKLYGFEDDDFSDDDDQGDDDDQFGGSNQSGGYGYESSDDFDQFAEDRRANQQGKKGKKHGGSGDDLDDEVDPEKADFVVRAFGLVQVGDKYYSASIDLTKFQPFFFIKIPEHWSQFELDQLVSAMRAEAHFTFSDHLVKWRIIKRKPFYGFTGTDQFQYAELTFSTLFGFHKYSWILMKGVKGVSYPRLESNIEPMLRLIHIQNITPSGWIKIPAGQFNIPHQKTSDCQIHLRMKYDQVVSLPDKIDIPPLEYASFDIEADSSHGDFPVGQKDYQKLAQDIITEYLKLPSYNRNEFTLRNIIRTWLALAFHDYYYNNNINRIITVENLKPSQEEIESLIPYIYELGNHYHQVTSSYQNKLQPTKEKPASLPTDEQQARFKSKITQLETRLHHLLENVLPPLDLSHPQRTSHYGLLSEQLLKEVHRSLETNNKQFQKDPPGCIRFWLNLAFDNYYNNNNIHWIETKKNRKPKVHVLDNLVPQIYWICQQCYDALGYNRQTGKGSSGKKPTKPKPPPLAKKAKPPSKGQSKLSNFFKVDKDEPTPENVKKTEIIQEPEYEQRKPWEEEEEPEIIYRGRMKKTLPDKPKRDFFVEWLRDLFNSFLPPVEGDPIIQIGTTYKRYGDSELFLKHIIVLDTCTSFTNEGLIEDENKGISMKMGDALAEAKKLNIENPSDDLKTLNLQIQTARRDLQKSRDKSVLRIESYQTEREVLLAWQKLIKLSDPDIIIGYNIFGFDFKYLWERAEELDCIDQFRDLGRVHKYPHELKEHKLSSSGLGDNILTYIPMTGRVIIDLFKVVQTGGYRLPFYKLDYVCKVFMSKQKNDLPPQQIFILQKGSARDRATIARYCLIDCILCNRLIDRLEIITNNIGMSQVCTVPLSYLFLRGQGIKILSLVSKICRNEGYLIKTKERVNDPDKYEGAIVLNPEKGIYFEPCVVADFNSLYPSCMIAENLSHDAYVDIGGKYDNLPGCEYVNIYYDLYEDRPVPGTKRVEKVKSGVKTCRFYQPPNGEKSLLPRILMKLLKARKDTRKEQKNYEKGSFKWNVKEGLQLAYKVTANSLYGQVGAKTSPVFLKDIAACTTSCGRTLIYKTKEFFEENYNACSTVYGDTDSVFLKFDARNSRGEKLRGLDAVNKSIELCTEGALKISRSLKKPHNLEFEKAIFPFMLLSKKRYHGHYYTEYGVPEYKAKSMGIVLKRRDNAEIVKTVFGGTLDIIMKEHDVEKAMDWCREACKRVIRGEYPMDKFILTKTLRSYYKTPDQIAHNVLAQRIGERDPGNKPKSNDRIAYAYIQVPEPRKGETILQGNRIETPEFIKENNLQIDYKFYLTNQIMKPVSQIFELIRDDFADIFTEALMEYDRAQSGMSRISAWVLPNSAEYRKRVDAMINDLLAEENLDEDPDIRQIEEMYGDD